MKIHPSGKVRRCAGKHTPTPSPYLKGITNLHWVTHQQNCVNRDNKAIGLKTWANGIALKKRKHYHKGS